MGEQTPNPGPSGTLVRQDMISVILQYFFNETKQFTLIPIADYRDGSPEPDGSVAGWIVYTLTTPLGDCQLVLTDVVNTVSVIPPTS
jgi:hypothetical protein